MTEPCGDLWREKWRQSAVDALVIGIEPTEFLCCEEILHDCRSVEMAACQGLEVEPVTEIGQSRLLAEDDILMTDSVHAFPIESWLV